MFKNNCLECRSNPTCDECIERENIRRVEHMEREMSKVK